MTPLLFSKSTVQCSADMCIKSLQCVIAKMAPRALDRNRKELLDELHVCGARFHPVEEDLHRQEKLEDLFQNAKGRTKTNQDNFDFMKFLHNESVSTVQCYAAIVTIASILFLAFYPSVALFMPVFYY